MRVNLWGSIALHLTIFRTGVRIFCPPFILSTDISQAVRARCYAFLEIDWAHSVKFLDNIFLQGRIDVFLFSDDLPRTVFYRLQSDTFTTKPTVPILKAVRMLEVKTAPPLTGLGVARRLTGRGPFLLRHPCKRS